MAKGWNYEAEQLIRSNPNIDYTIIRPGIMKNVVENEDDLTLGLKDNGGDLKVSAVSHGRIADLVIQAFQRDTCRRCTITAMNVNSTSSSSEKFQTLDQLQRDTRQFPDTLIDEHKKAARFGGLTILLVTFLVTKAVVTGLGRLLMLFLK